MREKNNKFIILLAVIIIIAGFAFLIYRKKTVPGAYDEFAQCLSESGAKFYGAYWCPHCKDQKKSFGNSFSYVNYVECALPGNPRAQTEECKNAGISGYPTWIFGDGSRKSGNLSLGALSEQSGCQL